MKLIASYIGLCLIPAISFADCESDIREHCALAKKYAAENMINSKSLSDFYFFSGKHQAYEEIINFIDED